MSNIKKTAQEKTAAHIGVLSKIRTYLERNRLGELMVLKGHISAGQLKDVLRLQKEQKRPIGQILIESNYVSRYQLQQILWRQRVLRITAGFLLCMLSMSSFGSKKAKADYIKDIPAKISISASAHFTAVASYPALLGSDEKPSKNLKPFTKWTEMFERFDRQIQTTSGQNEIKKWQASLRKFEDLPLKTMADKVNDLVNEARYITDQKNYGKSDIWNTPIEFLQNGGDCEDFAITKYTALRMLGVPEERLRIAIVHDNLKNIAHAILIVYTDQGAYFLDNQEKNMISAASYSRYRPIFSINRQAWWLHSTPKPTILASAE